MAGAFQGRQAGRLADGRADGLRGRDISRQRSSDGISIQAKPGCCPCLSAQTEETVPSFLLFMIRVSACGVSACPPDRPSRPSVSPSGWVSPSSYHVLVCRCLLLLGACSGGGVLPLLLPLLCVCVLCVRVCVCVCEYGVCHASLDGWMVDAFNECVDTAYIFVTHSLPHDLLTDSLTPSLTHCSRCIAIRLQTYRCSSCRHTHMIHTHDPDRERGRQRDKER